jgi:predicted phage terminase large subunit-like protein
MNKSSIHRQPNLLLDNVRLVAEAERARAEARAQFFAFRRYIRPYMLWGWWVQQVALELQQFYDDFIAGRRPVLILQAPPQHGKSITAEDLMAWAAGRNPDLKIIYASFSDDLGIRTNLALQRTIQNPLYQLAFGNTRIGEAGWQCNNELIEFAGHRGSFRNVTVNGAVNGMELHLGVIDDPVKGRSDANSQLIRDKTWLWFTDDFRSRFARDSALLIIMTRWHVDDLAGRLVDRADNVRVLCYPAIAETRDDFRDQGEALFEKFKPLRMLQERKRELTQASWESLYQQHPVVVGGGILPIEKFKILPALNRSQIRKSVRYVDKAATAGGDGAYTAMVLMHAMKNGTFVIEDSTRGRWGVLEREQKLKSLAAMDSMNIKGPYEIIIEQEPGSGGKESVEATIRSLAGYRVFPDRVTGSKQVRAEPFAAQVQAENVFLVEGHWVRGFLEEAECFPYGKFNDQIDAAAGAFARLTSKPVYNLDALAT